VFTCYFIGVDTVVMAGTLVIAGTFQWLIQWWVKGVVAVVRVVS